LVMCHMNFEFDFRAQIFCVATASFDRSIIIDINTVILVRFEAFATEAMKSTAFYILVHIN
jgi:hypothetical protein